eukprot:4568-Heterococcus_DN1.PRE.1
MVHTAHFDNTLHAYSARYTAAAGIVCRLRSTLAAVLVRLTLVLLADMSCDGTASSVLTFGDAANTEESADVAGRGSSLRGSANNSIGSSSMRGSKQVRTVTCLCTCNTAATSSALFLSAVHCQLPLLLLQYSVVITSVLLRSSAVLTSGNAVRNSALQHCSAVQLCVRTPTACACSCL